MAQRKKKAPARPAEKPTQKRQGGVRKARAVAAPKLAYPIGHKTQGTANWVDVTITRWNGFFRGVMLEVISNYTAGGFEAYADGRCIGKFPTADAAKAGAVKAVNAQEDR